MGKIDRIAFWILHLNFVAVMGLENRRSVLFKRKHLKLGLGFELACQPPRIVRSKKGIGHDPGKADERVEAVKIGPERIKTAVLPTVETSWEA